MVSAAYGKRTGWNMRHISIPAKSCLKLCVLLLMSLQVLAFPPAGESQVVSLSFKEAPLQKVFAEIRKQTGYSFAYFEADLAKAKPVSISISNMRVQEALASLFQDQPLTFTIIEKVVVVKQKAEKKISGEQSPREVLPPIDVRGRVINEEDEPVAGVSVQIKGTNTGTSTDGEGEFVLRNVESDAVLVLSAVNIQRVEAGINGRRYMDVRVKGKTGKLDEVQVIAYGTTSQRLNTGNVSTVKAADIEKQPVQNPLLALQGRVPGLVVTQTTGIANGHVKVRIQGQNSIVDNRSEPLIVVDGIPYPTTLEPDGSGSPLSVNDPTKGASPLSFINPADIESIDILKDADATAIYGSRGANGVILITTKKGRVGRAKIDIKMQQGWGKVTRKLDLMNTRQYLDMRYEAIANDGLSITSATNVDLRLWDTTRYTDWQKVLIGETAQYTTVNAGISGGTNAAQYYIGGTYSRVTDVIPGDMANKSGSMHFSINTASANQKFKMQLSGSYLTNENRLPGVDLTEAALSYEPVAPSLFKVDGSLNWSPNTAGSSTWDNPLVYTLFNNVRHQTKNLLGSAGLSYLILPGLQVKSTFGYNNLSGSNFRGTPLEYFPPEDRPTSTRGAFISKTANSSWIIEPQLFYQVKLKAIKIDALAGGTIQKTSNESLRVSASGFTSDLLMESMQAAASTNVSSGRIPYRYAALFGRLNLNMDNKYILNLNARRDGSSRFGDANKFHNFSSAAAAWIFSEEKWIKQSLPFLSFGKLRASYGITGSDQIGDYQYVSLYTTSSTNIPYQGIVALFPNGLSNPHLQWEEVRKLSLGMDLGFLNDRILLNINYGKNECSNQLQILKLPSITGFTGVLTNFPAVVRNTSWEFLLNAAIIRRKDITWSATINVTMPENKLVAFPDIENSSYANGNSGVIVGQPLGVVKAFKYAGIDPATGKGLVYDVHGNPTATPSAATDRTELIATIPDFYGGFNNSISYKGFQLDFLFQFTRQMGARDQYYFNRISPPGRFQVGRSNQPVSVLAGRWQKPGDQASMIRFSTTTSVVPRGYGSDAYYTYDASYIRLKNLSLSWQLPAEWSKKAGMQSARINFQGQNMLTITNYSGLDPETGGGYSLPPLQIWTMGIQLVF